MHMCACVLQERVCHHREGFEGAVEGRVAPLPPLALFQRMDPVDAFENELLNMPTCQISLVAVGRLARRPKGYSQAQNFD